MFNHRRVAALDLGTSKVVSMIGCKADSGNISVLGMASMEYAGLKDGQWLEPDRLKDTIASAHHAAEKQAKKRIRDVYVGVPGEFIRVFFRDVTIEPSGKDHIITEDDMDRILQEACDVPVPGNYVLLHHSHVLFFVDGQIRWDSPIGHKAGELVGYVSLTMADVSFLKQMEDLLADIGLGVIAFVAAPVSTARLIRRTVAEKKSIIVLDGGFYSTDLMVLEGRDVVFHKNIPMGGQSIVNDLMRVMNISAEQAELIKRRCAVGVITDGSMKPMNMGMGEENMNIDLQTAQSVIEARLDELGSLLRSELEAFGSMPGSRSQFFVTGGGYGMLRGAREYIGQALGTMARPYVPQLAVTSSPTATAAVGVLYYGIYGEKERMNASWYQDIWQRFKEFI